MPANIAISFNTSSSESTTSLVEARFTSQDLISLQKNLPAGDGDGQCNLIFEKRGSAAATPEDIDLSMVADQNGGLAAFAKVKAMIVCNKSAENSLEVAGSYFGTTPAIVIPAGGALILVLPVGVDITPDSNDGITIGSALGADYEMRVVGTAVSEEHQE